MKRATPHTLPVVVPRRTILTARLDQRRAAGHVNTLHFYLGFALLYRSP